MKELTLIIPFLNEGREVYNTVKSFKDSADIEIDIILINDGSDDGYDYKAVAEEFDTIYIEHSERKGVASSRDEGIHLSRTEYFLLLDAHMRTFQNDWASILLKLLNQNKRSVFNCCTYSLNDDGSINEIIRKNDEKSLGAFMDLDDLSVKWLAANSESKDSTYEIPCILGASYACNKTYWKRLKGLSGLLYYGLDEQFISMKAYLEGGNCLAVRKIVFGHIFRESVDKVPYKTEGVHFILNKFFIAELLYPIDLKIKFIRRMMKDYNTDFIQEVLNALIDKKEEVRRYKEYFQKIFTVPFTKVVKNNEYYKNIMDSCLKE